MKKFRIYLDTSVFGGYFDDIFQKATHTFFEIILQKKILPLISDMLLEEAADAPAQVRDLVRSTIELGCERLSPVEEAAQLQDAYLKAGIVSGKYTDDALHVALATLAQSDAIVSWNFKHLVNPLRIRRFNAVNISMGYGTIVIMSPEEMIHVLQEENDESKTDEEEI